MNPFLDFILLPFFHRLRKSSGMELDMTQYYLFLDLFMKGYGKDKASLLTLCKTLWLSQAKFRNTFDLWFDEAFKEINGQWLPETITPSLEEEIKQEDRPVEEQSISQPESVEKPKESIKPVEKEKEPGNIEAEVAEIKEFGQNLLDIVLNFEEGIGKRAPVDKKLDGRPSEKDTVFIFSDEKHLPVMSRRLGHALQKLRMTETLLMSDQLDISAIVRQFGKERSITRLDKKEVSSSNQNVLLLTDHEGSMSAFEAWGDFLFRSLEEHVAIDHINRFYFHNHPNVTKNNFGADTFKLFSNTNHTASMLAEQVFSKANGKSTWLIIFSDAGAYEKGIDSETLQYWGQFLEIARRQVAAITWINPLPKHRWNGNMAGYLSFLVKMIPFNLEGMKQAIKWANHANRNRTS